MRFSIALLSLAASIVSAGYVRPTPIDEECEGLTSVDFEFALGVKECDDKHVTVLDLVFELEDGQLEHDGCHTITCESCYTPETIVDDCDDCDDKKKKKYWYGNSFGNDDDDKNHKYKRGGFSSDDDNEFCEIRADDCEDVDFFKLCDTVLTDEKNRLGEIVANHQFQFDPFPGQPDALFKKGFTIVEKDEEHLLALYGKTKFWHCKVDNKGLYKIYDASIGGQCSPIELVIVKQKEEKKHKKGKGYSGY